MTWATADEWWRVACEELKAARLLKAVGSVNQAYFHAGQAIEFGLKALYLKRNGLPRMPDNKKGAGFHDLQRIAQDCRLINDLKLHTTSQSVRSNWLTVRDWRSNARFPDIKVARKEMTDFFIAVFNKKDGVWDWLETIYQMN